MLVQPIGGFTCHSSTDLVQFSTTSSPVAESQATKKPPRRARRERLSATPPRILAHRGGATEVYHDPRRSAMKPLPPPPRQPPRPPGAGRFANWRHRRLQRGDPRAGDVELLLKLADAVRLLPQLAREALDRGQVRRDQRGRVGGQRFRPGTLQRT